MENNLKPLCSKGFLKMGQRGGGIPGSRQRVGVGPAKIHRFRYKKVGKGDSRKLRLCVVFALGSEEMLILRTPPASLGTRGQVYVLKARGQQNCSFRIGARVKIVIAWNVKRTRCGEDDKGPRYTRTRQIHCLKHEEPIKEFRTLECN